MNKKIKAFVKLALPAGKATPTPPVGPILGQHGVNISKFCKEYNLKTNDQQGSIIPVKITIYEDKSYTFILKSSPTSQLLLKAIKINNIPVNLIAAETLKGLALRNKKYIGTVTKVQIREIALIKLSDLNTSDLTKAESIIMGTALNMGVIIS